LQESVL